jgi:hypothetical protein
LAREPLPANLVLAIFARKSATSRKIKTKINIGAAVDTSSSVMSRAVMPEARTANNVFVLVQPDITAGHMTFIGTYIIHPVFLAAPQLEQAHVD